MFAINDKINENVNIKENIRIPRAAFHQTPRGERSLCIP